MPLPAIPDLENPRAAAGLREFRADVLNGNGMRIVLITGSFPPDACGVGDYTCSLASSLEQAGASVEVFCLRKWGIAEMSQAVGKVLREKSSVVHIQYPSMGYGKSLGPQICALARKSVVTLHEFTKAHLLRKASLLPFTIRSPRLIVSSEFERAALVRKIPWIASRVRVIPIASNIASTSVPADCRRVPNVIYFGLIMPEKGLEDFVRLARIVRAQRRPWELEIIGKIAPGREQYARQMIASTLDLDIQWTIDLDAEQVHRRLIRSRLAYLPYPDGASERRGSLKSVSAAGLPCITTRSRQTPADLLNIVAIAATPDEAFIRASFLMENDGEWRRLSHAALNRSLTVTWPGIAESHIRLYNEYLQSRNGSGAHR